MTHDARRLGYLAGVVDCCGAIRMHESRGRTYPVIRVTARDFADPYAFVQSFGGRLTEIRGVKAFERTHIAAVEIVRKLRPYLRVTVAAADRALDWAMPTEPLEVKPRHVKVPCPNNCGNQMSLGSKICGHCYAEKMSVTAAQAREQAKVGHLTRNGGEIIRTPTGIIHKLRG